MGRGLSVLAILCCLPAMAAEVWHADFEQARDGQPVDWRFSATRGAVRGAWDAAEPAGGHSIRLEVTEAGGRATWTYVPRLELRPETNYRLHFRVLRAGIQPGGRAYVILYENGVEAPAAWHVSPYLGGTQDWQPYSVTFRTRPGVAWVRLQVKLWEAPGYAWFDDLRLEELGPEATPEAFQKQRPTPADEGWPLQAMWYPAQRRPDNTIHLLPGAVNPLALFFWGRRAEVREPYLVVETPPQIDLRGPVTSSRAAIPQAVALTPEPVTRDGQPARRWRVPLPAEVAARLRPTGPEWTAYHFVYAAPQPGCPQQFTWRWQIENGGRLGPPHEVPAQLAPRAAGQVARVASFPLYAQHTDALRLPTAADRAAVLDTLAYAGIEGGLSLAAYQPEYHAIDQELARQGFLTWQWLWDGYNQKGREGYPLVYDSPTETRALMCPQAQVERVEPWWSELRATYRSRIFSDSKTLIINFEPPYLTCCYCERCRKAFAAAAKLPADQVLGMTPQALKALPDDAWGRFRAWQNGQIVKHHCAAIHEVKPDVQVGLCGPAYTDWVARHGMDIRLFEPEVAFHAPMLYTVGAQYAADVRSTCEGTKAPVIPFVLASDLVVAGIFPSAAQVRQNLLVTAASGGRGAVLWVGIESLDAEYLNALRQSLVEIALLEPYLRNASRGERLSLQVPPDRVRTIQVDGRTFQVAPVNTGLSTLQQWAWESPRGRLVVLVNYDELSAQRIDVGNAKRLFGPALTEAGGKNLLSLAPGEVAAVVWERR